MNVIELFEKKTKVLQLVDEIAHPVLLDYFDYESNENLDKKIKVLEQMKAGVAIDDIDGFWDILELYPKENVRI